MKKFAKLLRVKKIWGKKIIKLLRKNQDFGEKGNVP